MKRHRASFVAGSVLVAMLGQPAGAMESSVSGISAGAAYVSAVEENRNGNFSEAVKLLRIVLNRQPRNADALNQMGFSQRKLGNFEQAFAYYHQALAIEPDHLGANEYIGEAYLETDDLDMAEQHLAKLGSLCGTACEEYKALKAAIGAFKAGSKSSRTW